MCGSRKRKFHVDQPIDGLQRVGADLTKSELAIHANCCGHGLHVGIEAHGAIAEVAGFLHDLLRQLPADLVAPKRWAHVETLHLAGAVARKRTQSDAAYWLTYDLGEQQ